MVRVPTGSFLVPSGLDPIWNSASFWDNWMKLQASFLPRVCALGQKEDFFCLLLGQPGRHEDCIQLHGCGWPTTRDKLIYAGRGNNPHQRCKHLYGDTAMLWRKRPLLMSNNCTPTRESADVWHKLTGVGWKKGGGRR